MNPSCMPFSGEMSGITEVIIPIPMNEIDAIETTRSAARKFAFGRLRSKKSATTTNRSEARASP